NLHAVELGEDHLALIGKRADDRPRALVDELNHAPRLEVLVGQLLNHTMGCRSELVASGDRRDDNGDRLVGHGRPLRSGDGGADVHLSQLPSGPSTLALTVISRNSDNRYCTRLARGSAL